MPAAPNIQQRTFEFGVRIIRIVDRLPCTTAGIQTGRQLVASGTSIGANMQEADGAESRADFIHKVGIALKEAKETHYWLRLINASLLVNDDEIRSLIQEAMELSRIIATIRRNTKNPHQ